MLLHQILDNAAAQTPNKQAVIGAGGGCTYRQLQEKMNLWAKALLSLGIQRGDRVALFMKNRVELAQMYFACFRIGAIAVPLNARYRTPEAQYALEQSGSRILITCSKLFPVVKDTPNTVPCLEGLYVIDENPENPSIAWSKISAAPDESIPVPNVDLHDPAIIIYTSGSTSSPKGAVHTHFSLYHHILNKTQAQEMNSSDIVLAATQISHIAAFAGLMLPTLYNGGTFVMLHEFDPADYIRHLKTYRPTNLLLLPTELLEVLEHPAANQANFSRLRSMLVIGDKVPHHVYELFRDQTGFDLIEGCGMTECEGYCSQPKHGKKKPGSIGQPIPGIKIRLTDPNGEDVPDGQTGEILLKADSMLAGYWNKPEETQKAFVDGWFRTGDLAYKDEDGYYHFVSRLKEIIIRGGSNITPGEVEDVLDDHPDVNLSGVVGFPDEHYGSIVGAFIMPQAGRPAPTAEELAAFAAQRLAQYKVPEKWIFVEHLPRNAVGKIDRRELHRLAKTYGDA